MRLISRSSHEALGTCPRRAYYQYEFQGGYDSATPAMNLLIGIAVHRGLEIYFGSVVPFGHPTVSSEDAALLAKWELERLTEPYKERLGENPKLMSEIEEDAVLVFALVYGWLSRRAAAFLEEFEILQVEKELRTPLSPDVVLMSRLDLLVRERATGLVQVWNWKTTSTADPEKLYDTYKFESQMWAEALAAEWDLGEPVQGTICEAFYKGTRRNGTYSNALLYVYHKEGVFKSDYTKGWQKIRVDQLPGGATKHIDSLPLDVINKFFYRLPPILKNNAVVEDRLEIWVHQEGQAAHVLENGTERDKLKHFAPRSGPWCSWCPFREPCYGVTTMEEAIASGKLVKRVDHHGEAKCTTGA